MTVGTAAAVSVTIPGGYQSTRATTSAAWLFVPSVGWEVGMVYVPAASSTVNIYRGNQSSIVAGNTLAIMLTVSISIG